MNNGLDIFADAHAQGDSGTEPQSYLELKYSIQEFDASRL
jgi:hypothetical protein